MNQTLISFENLTNEITILLASSCAAECHWTATAAIRSRATALVMLLRPRPQNPGEQCARLYTPSTLLYRVRGAEIKYNMSILSKIPFLYLFNKRVFQFKFITYTILIKALTFKVLMRILWSSFFQYREELINLCHILTSLCKVYFDRFLKLS